MPNSGIENIEQQRSELESNIAKLRNALRHWQTLELDYEGLKDEFLGLREDANRDACQKAAQDFEPHKVDEKELNELIEPQKGKVRSPSQIVDTLSKRIEYVLRNITSLRDQIAQVEKKRNAILLSQAHVPAEDAQLPVTEILEELDEEDNVVSSTLRPEHETASKALGVLDEAAVPSADDRIKDIADIAPAVNPADKNVGPKQDLGSLEDSDTDSVISEIISEGAGKAARLGPTNPDDTEEEARLRQEMLQYGLGEVGNIVAELELADAANGGTDEDEDVEDYSDLEDDDFDEDMTDDDDSEDEGGQTRRSMHSEKYRRQMQKLQEDLGLQMQNVGPELSLPGDFKDQIEHLPVSEARDYIDSLPPALRNHIDRQPDPKEAARQAAIARYEANKSTEKQIPQQETQQPPITKSKKVKKSQKKVAFAPDLDIAPDKSTTSSQPPSTTGDVVERSSIASSSTILDSKRPPTTSDIVERPTSTTSTDASTKSTKLPSRFKQQQSRTASLFPPPMSDDLTLSSIPANPANPPQNTTHSTTLVERSPNPSKTTAPLPSDPDDFDADLQARQLALEHHTLQNRLVHASGGYVKGGEAENWGDEVEKSREFVDPNTGEVRKVSRFKASRMR